MNNNEKFTVYGYDILEQGEEAWDKLANWYSARKKGSYEFKIQLPAILNLLGNLRGKSLIDIGCGPSTYSVEFARALFFRHSRHNPRNLERKNN